MAALREDSNGPYSSVSGGEFYYLNDCQFLERQKDPRRGSQESDLSRTGLTGFRIAISLSRQMKSHSRMFHHVYGEQ
jgi:hypothetical protein